LILILRARTHAAEVRIICASSSFDNLDESLPCLVYDNDGDDTPDCENINSQSSLFSEINSLVYYILYINCIYIKRMILFQRKQCQMRLSQNV
jgi:hypothetical protein